MKRTVVWVVLVAVLLLGATQAAGQQELLCEDPVYVPEFEHPVVTELCRRIAEYGWGRLFDAAVVEAQSHKVYDWPELQEWQNYRDYLEWLDQDLLKWVPIQEGDSRNVYEMIIRHYFILDQPPVRDLQSPIEPGAENLTPLSEWMVQLANAWGMFLDTPESAGHVKTFKDDIWFRWDDYMPPPASFLTDPERDWMAYRTFNQFFARHVKPGKRPIAGLCDDSVIVSPADSTFVGWWQINDRSQIYVQETQPLLHVKGLTWSIEELLKDSAYADRFRGGIFAHHFLNSFDYHRWHAPVGGKVLESRVIQGQVYLDVITTDVIVEEGGEEKTVTVIDAVDGTGYQFLQTRGLIVIDSPIGLVACLPMGMAQVSSIVITAEEGVTLRKGEELGYFQFGGSDFVLVFERASNVDLTWQPGVHKQQGQAIGRAYPYGED